MKSLKDFIKEQLDIEYNFSIFTEKNNKYDGQDDLAKYLTNIIYTYYKKKNHLNHFYIHTDKLNKFKNIFFNQLEFTLVKNINDDYFCSFNASDSKFIKNKLHTVHFFINEDIINNRQNLCVSIMHELSHARHHYSAIVYGTKMITELTDSASKYRKTLLKKMNNMHDNNEFAEYLCKTICNRLFKFEQSAYLSELHVSIDYSKCENEDDVLNQLRMTDTWAEFNSLHSALENISLLNDEQKKCFENKYNEINSTNIKYRVIKKHLLEKLDNFIRKMENLAIKIMKEYYKEDEDIMEYHEVRVSADFIKELNFRLYEYKRIDINIIEENGL